MALPPIFDYRRIYGIIPLKEGANCGLKRPTTNPPYPSLSTG